MDCRVSSQRIYLLGVINACHNPLYSVVVAAILDISPTFTICQLILRPHQT